MSERKLRTNRVPLPKSLEKRDHPKLNFFELEERSAGFLTMEMAIRRPELKKPKIVSSAHGPINHILFCYPFYASEEHTYKNIYEELFRKLPDYTKFTILCNQGVLDDLKGIVESTNVSSRSEIVVVGDHLNFSVWAEDPYVIIHDIEQTPSKLFFVEPFTFRRSGDSTIASRIVSNTSMEVFQSPLYFEGGNILIGDNFVLLGADYPVKTLELIRNMEHISVPSDQSPAVFVKELYKKTFNPNYDIFYVGTKSPVPSSREVKIELDGNSWVEEVYLGTGQFQPIFHIDMFISLAGRNSSGNYRVLVGSPTIADQLLDWETIPYSISQYFDEVAENLENQGFEVVRNPLPLTYVDDYEYKKRTWYFATANNCLVQIDEEKGNKVWLPTYGHGDWDDLTPIDQENKKIWQNLGFEVVELGDFHPFVQNLGSVHCIKKYLHR